jgi:2-polyprenyl-3-methyl-5-hydroxy-6-metoxy-1,4-benzoquinol methylase
MSQDYQTKTEINRLWWNERVASHVRAPSYGTQDVLQGKPKPMTLERSEIGDVKGKSLLHMQCHFGLDTLSWALYGADVTGLDFSSEAIETASTLAKEAGLTARFLETNILEADKALNEQFDIVFTSWGILGWLPDHERWAEVVANFVKPGGTFYIAEIHPMLWMFDDEDEARIPKDKPVYYGLYDYFNCPEPLDLDSSGSYASPETDFRNNRTNEWSYDLGRIITLLIEKGLTINFVHEHDFTCNGTWPCMVEIEDGYWSLPKDWPRMPLSFSIKATKPA